MRFGDADSKLKAVWEAARNAKKYAELRASIVAAKSVGLIDDDMFDALSKALNAALRSGNTQSFPTLVRDMEEEDYLDPFCSFLWVALWDNGCVPTDAEAFRREKCVVPLLIHDFSTHNGRDFLLMKWFGVCFDWLQLRTSSTWPDTVRILRSAWACLSTRCIT